MKGGGSCVGNSSNEHQLIGFKRSYPRHQLEDHQWSYCSSTRQHHKHPRVLSHHAVVLIHMEIASAHSVLGVLRKHHPTVHHLQHQNYLGWLLPIFIWHCWCHHGFAPSLGDSEEQDIGDASTSSRPAPSAASCPALEAVMMVLIHL